MKWLDKWRYGPMTRERCETCNRPLRAKQVRELVEATFDSDGMGGSILSAVYCPADYPKVPA